MIIKKFKKYNEDLNIEDDYKLDNTNIKKYLDNIIEKSLNSSDIQLKKDFIKSYLKDESTIIEGLVNDSDIFDFYIINKDDIDVLLNEVNYFESSPQDNNIYGIYDYIIFSTKRAISEVLKDILEDF